jgi:hypothetical protein
MIVLFMVVRWISTYTDEVEIPESIWIDRLQPVSVLDPVVNDPFPGQRMDPSPSPS